MEKILVSACLLGENCRYDGKNNQADWIEELKKRFDIVPFCPEVEGGLPTPRTPSEIKNGQVYNKEGKNVSKQFDNGAQKALNICLYLGIHLAILKEGSPSCGVHKIHNGKFDGKLVDGKGITASLLASKNINLMNEEEAAVYVQHLLDSEAAKAERLAKAAEEAANKPEEEKKEEAPVEEKEERPSREGGYQRRPRRDGKPSGKKPFGKKPFGKKPYGKPGDKKPYGKRDGKPGEKKPYGKPGDKKPFGKKPFGKKPFGKPGAKKPYGKRPYAKKEGE